MNKVRIGKIVCAAATTVVLTSASLLTSGGANADVSALGRFLRAIEPQIAKLGTRQAGEFGTTGRRILSSADAQSRGEEDELLRFIRGACSLDRLQNTSLSAEDYLQAYFPSEYEQVAVWHQYDAYKNWRLWDENGHQYVEIICDEVKHYRR